MRRRNLTTIVVDFETFFDKKDAYTLKVMPTPCYVRDSRFKIHGAGVCINDEEPMWITDMEVLQDLIIRNLPATIIGHNLLFDGLILVEVLGIPRTGVTWCDTLSLARGCLSVADYSLEALSKGSTAEKQKMPDHNGLRYLDTAMETALGNYCLADVKATKALYERLVGQLPEDELRLVHLTVEMGVRARLLLDQELLNSALNEAKTERQALIDACGYDRATLASNQKFAAVLQELGVPVPTKVSARTGKDTFALAKSDLDFQRLRGQYPQYQALFDAREECMSSIKISRIESFQKIAETGALPVPLAYFGADSGRWSGRGGINLQNLPRGSDLRKSIRAPDGLSLVVGDLGQIEARMLAMLAGEYDLIQTFKQNKDVYTEHAKRHFGKDDISKDERQFAKMLVLALGYGMSWMKFAENVRKGFMGSPPINISDYEAKDAVNSYRAINSSIVRLWANCEDVIAFMAAVEPGHGESWGPLVIEHCAIRLPNGMRLRYPNLHRSDDGWRYGGNNSLYGGKLTNHITQGCARIVMSEAWLRISDEGYSVVLSCHDELGILARAEEAKQAERALEKAMTQPPNWMPDIPLTADVHSAQRYEK